MPDLSVTIVLPNGGARRAEIPDDVPVGELLLELTSCLSCLRWVPMDAQWATAWIAKPWGKS